jgi:hypothetical protein
LASEAWTTAEMASQYGVHYNCTSKKENIFDIFEFFCNKFLYEVLNVGWVKRNVRNYFIFAKNFVCVFTMSIQGLAACIAEEPLCIYRMCHKN